MRSLSPTYVDDWEPRIGRNAVNAYLTYRKALRIGRVVAGPSWLLLFCGIGLGVVPLTILGGLLLALNFWIIFIHGWGSRRLAIAYARQYVGVPPDHSPPPVSGSPDLFDVWARSRGYSDTTWAPKFPRRSS